MRIWLKYLIAMVIGAASAVFLPPESAGAQALLDFVVELVMRFGRYTLLPVLFFSIATACFKLRDEKLMLKTGVWTFGTILVSSFALMLLGLLSALIIRLPRIPITIEKVSEVPVFNWHSLLTKNFPLFRI